MPHLIIIFVRLAVSAMRTAVVAITHKNKSRVLYTVCFLAGHTSYNVRRIKTVHPNATVKKGERDET